MEIILQIKEILLFYIIKNVKPKMDYIPQRWDATAHEVASFVNNNTDIVILTMFASLSDISVYTVYKSVESSSSLFFKKFLF